MSEVTRVLHVIPSIDLADGGPSVMVEMIARGLAQAGIEIHVATTVDGDGVEGGGQRPVVRDGVTYWCFARQTRFYKFSWPLSRWLGENVARYQVVHIHALFSHAAVAASYWAKRRGVPYIVRPLGTLNRWGMENRRPWLKQLSFRMIERRIVESAALVHYTSEQECKEAALLGARTRPTVIPNPVREAGAAVGRGQFRARHPELQGREMVLFLSRFDRKKGLDLLLPAFARVRERFASAALVLAGDGDRQLVEELRSAASGLGIAGDVFWPGFLKGEEKRAAFADADVFVLPSYSENFGIAVTEALAAGCPVVVSDQVAIHSDISAANAGLVVACDAGELASAICRVLGDRSASEVMGNNGKCLTQTQYSLNTVTTKLVNAYNSIGL